MKKQKSKLCSARFTKLNFTQLKKIKGLGGDGDPEYERIGEEGNP